MTDMAVRMGGGFHGPDGPPGASEWVRARIAAADAAYEREARLEEQADKVVREMDEDARVMLSIRMAEARGEVVDVRAAYRDGGIGRTHREIIDAASAMQDYDDQRLEARRQAAMAKLNLEWYGSSSADTSAPTPAELEAGADQQAHATQARSWRYGRMAKAKATVEHDNRLLDRVRREARMGWPL